MIIRFITLIIGAVIAISLLRSVIGFLGNLFGNFAARPSRPESASRPGAPEPSQPESLKKDPVCGTFVAPSTALHKRKEGQIYYFCSAECRDKFD